MNNNNKYEKKEAYRDLSTIPPLHTNGKKQRSDMNVLKN